MFTKKFLIKMSVENESDFVVGDVIRAISDLITDRSYTVANISVKEV